MHCFGYCSLRHWTTRPPVTRCRSAAATAGLAVALCLLIPSTPALAQLLRGRVLDAGSGEPVAAAVVWVRTPDGTEVARALSGEDGRFATTLEGVTAPAILVLRMSRIGYDSTATTSVHLDRNQDLEVEIRIRPRAIDLPGIEVTAERLNRYLTANGFYWRKRMGFGVFMDEAQITQMHPIRSHDVFRGIAGVRLEILPTGDEEPFITRGGGFYGPCSPALWIDGMKVRNSGELGPMNALDRLLLPEELGGVEVYRGPAEAPAQYRKDAVCGVVVVWSKH